MCTFFPNKSFGLLLDISPTIIKFLSLLSSECLHFEVWFTTDQNFKPPKTEARINLALVIDSDMRYMKMRYSFEARDRIFT